MPAPFQALRPQPWLLPAARFVIAAEASIQDEALPEFRMAHTGNSTRSPSISPWRASGQTRDKRAARSSLRQGVSLLTLDRQVGKMKAALRGVSLLLF